MYREVKKMKPEEPCPLSIVLSAEYSTVASFIFSEAHVLIDREKIAVKTMKYNIFFIFPSIYI